MLQLYFGSDFYNIIFKIKHKFYIAAGSDPPLKISEFAPARRCSSEEIEAVFGG